MEKFQINIVVQELEEIFETYNAFKYDFRDALKMCHFWSEDKIFRHHNSTAINVKNLQNGTTINYVSNINITDGGHN
jgi:hypothetical protein